MPRVRREPPTAALTGRPDSARVPTHFLMKRLPAPHRRLQLWGKHSRASDCFPSLGHPKGKGFTMLVLTRRPNESVLLLGLGITVVVLEVRG